MSMHPDRLIVCTYIRSVGLSMVLDDLNTLTLQSGGMNNAPRDPLHGSVTWNPSWQGTTYVWVYGYVYSPTWNHDCRKQWTLCCYVKSPPIATSYPPPQSPSLESAVSYHSTVSTWFESSFLTGFDSEFPDSVRIDFLTGFNSGLLDSIRPKVFDWIRISFPDPIWLMVFDGI